MQICIIDRFFFFVFKTSLACTSTMLELSYTSSYSSWKVKQKKKIRDFLKHPNKIENTKNKIYKLGHWKQTMKTKNNTNAKNRIYYVLMTK